MICDPTQQTTTHLFLTQRIALMYHPGQPENTFPLGIVRQCLSLARSVAINPPVSNILHQP
ncbi:hypothetical protein QS597_21925 [Escherichia coli]|uniref:hypothetical protein n=1 Tax=Escherichia coli TaxID=562 RepID=UPI0001F91B48|nr:hypothetical protein [Escherichia coli]EGW66895.1 hypothetical protein EC253486_3966 [Escherichia coli 2534-86]EHW07018.1 hypothetical protein ECDEC8A_3666 [Escherichia coli DEC8A]EHW07818.1 hypothetical protein ECDEC8B_4073 [Escherichia coli DEC8B]EHW25448.1 hypothetical protein ECDEC8E_3901 [Escherichia coli DEC8E]UWB90724.1 hypothetical protein M5T42_07295 [Escherichia coli O25b:H4-ST131]